MLKINFVDILSFLNDYVNHSPLSVKTDASISLPWYTLWCKPLLLVPLHALDREVA